MVEAVVARGDGKPVEEKEGLRRHLAEAHLFVLACVPEAGGGSDNLPTVIMEAMACGVPVISTRLAGVPEMIDDGEDGHLVAPRDPAALAGAMEDRDLKYFEYVTTYRSPAATGCGMGFAYWM